MQAVNYLHIITAIFCCLQVHASDFFIKLINDGPSVKGGSITFQADLYRNDGSIPSGTFTYRWVDNGQDDHIYETPETGNTTSIWKVSYPANDYPSGEYRVQVQATKHNKFWFPFSTSQHGTFGITDLLNGNMTIIQSNRTRENNFVSSETETNIMIDLRNGDLDYISKNATEISIFWFIDCMYFGQSSNFDFKYNFTKVDTQSTIEALVVASFEPLTTPAPFTTSTTTKSSVTITTAKTNITYSIPTNVTTRTLNITTLVPTVEISRKISRLMYNKNVKMFSGNNIITQVDKTSSNIILPVVCIKNSSMIISDPNKTYGYFHRKVRVNAPIKDISVEGTNWIEPWDILSLNVSCHGSGPFRRCLEYHPGNYTVTGNETCGGEGIPLPTCNFQIRRLFLEINVYTVLIILQNNISTEIYPVTVNIYKVTAKPQLSVIVVPVSCSLAAVVVVVFGIAYYIQNRARFTVEVADFDFAQNNPEMEYKSFGERLRDSINSTGYKPLRKPKTNEN